MSTRAFRTVTLVTALALAALIPALFLSTPAQAQDNVRDEIVRITDVFSGTQASSVRIVLEYPQSYLQHRQHSSSNCRRLSLSVFEALWYL